MGFKDLANDLESIVADTISDSIKMIDIAELHSSDDNFFEVNRIEELAESILGQGGVKENLIVRPLSSGGYEIISGHRRKSAVQYLIDSGEEISHFLPCLVQDYTNENDKLLDLILMNTSQRVLSDSETMKSFEKLNAILKEKKDLGEKFGKTREKIAETLNLSSSQVRKLQNVDKNAIPEIKEAIKSGEISINTADKVARLDKSEQKKVADNISDEPMTPKAVEKLVSEKVVISDNFSDNNSEKKKDDIIFRNVEHAELYEEILDKMKNKDVYHTSVAYLLSLDEVLTSHIKEVFNFKDDSIIHEALSKPWQTDSSRKTTRLIYNLWNGYSSDGETYTDDEGYELDLPSHYYAVDEIFCCAYARYYWQAVKLRFSIKER